MKVNKLGIVFVGGILEGSDGAGLSKVSTLVSVMLSLNLSAGNLGITL